MNLRSFKILALLVFTSSQIFSQIIITEVMYDPTGTDTIDEFVEIYNSSSTLSIDLTNWTISDKSSTDILKDFGYGLLLTPLNYAVIMDNDYVIASGTYKNIIPPSAILIDGSGAIGNGLSTSDSLYLKDNTNILIDSYGWTDTSPDGFSLEKIWFEQPNTADNWSASKDSLGTPGASNSVAPLAIDGEIQGKPLIRGNQILFGARNHYVYSLLSVDLPMDEL